MSSSAYKTVVLGGGNSAGYAAWEWVKREGGEGLAIIGDEPVRHEPMVTYVIRRHTLEAAQMIGCCGVLIKRRGRTNASHLGCFCEASSLQLLPTSSLGLL